MLAVRAVAVHPMQEEMRRPRVRIGGDAGMAMVHPLLEDRFADGHGDRTIGFVPEISSTRDAGSVRSLPICRSHGSPSL